MVKQNLDQDGVKLKLNELYLLDDILLKEEATRIREDFLTWLDDNFDLTQTQRQYLVQFMAADFRQMLANQISAAVEGRFPINYNDQGGQIGARTSKRFELKSDIRILNHQAQLEGKFGGLELTSIY